MKKAKKVTTTKKKKALTNPQKLQRERIMEQSTISQELWEYMNDTEDYLK
jgi:hypothetical protein